MGKVKIKYYRDNAGYRPWSIDYSNVGNDWTIEEISVDEKELETYPETGKRYYPMHVGHGDTVNLLYNPTIQDVRKGRIERKRGEMNHTPTPWKLVFHAIETNDGTSIIVWLSDITEDDAVYIVHCVNMHEELVEALKFYADKENYKGNQYCPPYNGYAWNNVDEDDGQKARAVLAKEKEE